MQPERPPVTAAMVVATEVTAVRPMADPATLRRVGGITLLSRAVQVLRTAGVGQIVVVVGYRGDRVTAAIREVDLPVEVVVNDDWERGVVTSVLAGSRLIPTARFLVVMGNQIFESEDVQRLLAAPARSALAVRQNPVGRPTGLSGVLPIRVRTDPAGRVLELSSDLEAYDAVDAGLAVLEVADVARAAASPPATSWEELHQRMLADGSELTACVFDGLTAAVDTQESERATERAMWGRHGRKATDGVIARTVNRRISEPITLRLLRTGLTPDVATLIAFTTTLLAAGLIALGSWWAMVVGGLGVMLGSALDGVDGELARVSGRASRRGAALDTLLDRYADLAVVLGLVVAAGATEAAWGWGFAAACGCLLVSYVHAIGRETDVRLLFRREFRLLILALAAIVGLPLWGLVVVAVAANLDALRGVWSVLRAMRA